MAADQSTKWHPLPPPHAGVLLTVNRNAAHLIVEYRGTPADLVAAGCATVAMLKPGKPPRCDSFGQPFFRRRAGQHGLRVTRYARTLEQARALPGVLTAAGGLVGVLVAGGPSPADRCRFTIEATAEALEAAMAALWAIDPDDDDVDPAKIPCPPRLFPVLEVAHSCLFPAESWEPGRRRTWSLPGVIVLMQRCLLANLAHLSLECESETLAVYQEAVGCLLSDPARAEELLAGSHNMTLPEALRRFHAKRLPAALWDGARLTL